MALSSGTDFPAWTDSSKARDATCLNRSGIGDHTTERGTGCYPAAGIPRPFHNGSGRSGRIPSRMPMTSGADVD